MDKLWFKILTVLLIFYTFIAGMIRPLNAGIMEVEPSTIQVGKQASINVNTYNTHLTEAPNEAWLSLDSNYSIKAVKVIPKKNNTVVLTFDIPAFLPGDQKIMGGSLIIANDIDGGFTRPGVFTLKQDSFNTDPGRALWSKDKVSELPPSLVKGFPFRLILEETIRNIYYHVPFWMAMIILFSISVFHAIQSLRKSLPADQMKVYAYNRIGFFYGLMGLITGAIWAKFTWGQYWSGDIKQNMTAIALLIYAAYFILWKSFKDETVQSRVSAVFTIFAYVAMIPLLFVIPRLYDSLHPGNGGNPALGGEDLDSTMRMVFYPGVIAFTMLGLWFTNIYYRIKAIDHKLKQ